MKHRFGQLNVTKVTRTFCHVSCGNTHLTLSSQLLPQQLGLQCSPSGLVFFKDPSLSFPSQFRANPPALTCTCLAATGPLNHPLPRIHKPPKLGAATLSCLRILDTTLCHRHPLQFIRTEDSELHSLDGAQRACAVPRGGATPVHRGGKRAAQAQTSLQKACAASA